MTVKAGAAGLLPATSNLLLGSLPDEEYRRLQPHLEPVRPR